MALAGCSAAESGAADATTAPGGTAAEASSRLQVATTVAPITSIVASIAGAHADVTGIVPEGVNSHTFEPKPSDAELLSTADVLFVNGLMLEEPTTELAEANMPDNARLVELGTQALPEQDWIFDFSFPEEEGKPNPHLWTDPRFADEYAQTVADTLAEMDPGNAGSYRANYQEFSALIDDLDEAMRADFATIPESNKKLLTYHDAYAYFAENYNWDVVGAIQVSDFGEPRPREVADLIEQIRDEDVPAVFGSEVFPSPVLEQIAAESGAEYVDDLRDDDLPGEPGDPEHSWIGLMRFNFETMTDALGGTADSLGALEVADATRDTAEYPQ